MLHTAKAHRSRQIACWASLACVALLLTACNSSTSSSAGPVTGPAAPPSSPAPAAMPTGAVTFLAPAQSLSAALLHEPACDGFGCALSGDSTSFLFHMTWTTWSGSQAVGRGTYKLDDCNPNCAGGHVYSVATVVTLSQPVKVCATAGPRWVWSHATFSFPHGLPTALQGQNAPQNPWTFSGLITAAQQTCTS
jgi:hypothetical protein